MMINELDAAFKEAFKGYGSSDSKEPGKKKADGDVMSAIDNVVADLISWVQALDPNSDFFKVAMYNGFDFEATAAQLIYDWNNGKRIHICVAIAFCLQAPGAISSKKLDNLEKNQAVKAAIEALGIKTKSSTTKPTEYTMSRIAAVMHPAMVSFRGRGQLADKFKLKPAANVTVQGLPRDPLFCSQEAAYAIPDEDKYNCIWVEWLKWAKKHHSTVNQGKKEQPQFNEAILVQKRASSRVPASAKINYCTGWDGFMRVNLDGYKSTL